MVTAPTATIVRVGNTAFERDSVGVDVLTRDRQAQAIVGAHRFIFDSRDDGQWERLEILNDQAGVWKCRTVFNCTEACPRGIEVTKAISEVKQALTTGEI